MTLNTIDWLIIVSYFVVALSVGIWVSRRAGRSSAEFFLSGRTMPWWLLGASMVATTFSCDTPTLITDMVRQNGVAGYWEAWVFLLSALFGTGYWIYGNYLPAVILTCVGIVSAVLLIVLWGRVSAG
jgi:Na+/proline symporter